MRQGAIRDLAVDSTESSRRKKKKIARSCTAELAEVCAGGEYRRVSLSVHPAGMFRAGCEKEGGETVHVTKVNSVAVNLVVDAR